MTDSGQKSSKENNLNHKCKVCHLSFDDIYAYTEHLESKAHIKGLMKHKYGEKYLEAKEMLDEKSNKNKHKTEDLQPKDEEIAAKASKKTLKSEEIVAKNSKKSPKPEEIESEGDEDDSDEDDVYTCQLCKKICTGILNYKLHLSGNKHLKKVKQLKLLKELDEKNCDPSDYTAPDMEILDQIMSKKLFKASERVCKLCDVSCSGPEVLKQHLRGESHKKRAAMEILKKEMKEDGIPAAVIKKERGDEYACETCNKAFSGIVPYSQHMNGISHLKQERDKKIREKVKNQFVVSPENSKIKCIECNREFSGSSQFEEHLKGDSHNKLKKKEILYQDLKKKFPEMLETTLPEDSDSDNEGESAKPACGICHVIFSGPEAARDHFTSEKHKKALKKKKLIEKNKIMKNSEKLLKKVTLSEKKRNSDEKETSSDDDFEKISA